MGRKAGAVMVGVLLVLLFQSSAWGQSRSDSTAQTWRCDPFAGPSCNEALNAVDLYAPGEGWAVGHRGAIARLHQGVWSWTPSPATVGSGGAYYGPNLLDVKTVSADEAWAVGSEETLLHYTGGAWQKLDFSLPHKDLLFEETDLFGLDMTSPNDGMIVGEGGAVVHYEQGQWVDTGSLYNGYAVSMISAGEGWAVGAGGNILHFVNGAWQRVTSPTTRYLFGVDMVSAGEGWAVGEAGTILHYQNGTWQRVNQSLGATLRAVDMVSQTEGWAAGFGTIFHYKDGAWQQDTFRDWDAHHLSNSYFYDIHMSSPTTGWAVGRYNPSSAAFLVLYYVNGAWQKAPGAQRLADESGQTTAPVADVDAPQSEQAISGTYYGVDMLDEHEALVVGAEQAAYVKDGAWQTTPFYSAVPVVLYGVDMVGPGEGWAVGARGRIYHFADGAWNEIQSPTDVDLFDVQMTSAGQGWATGDGVILRYENGAWQVVQSSRPTSYDLFAVDMLSPDEGWAVGDNGRIVHYKDGVWSRVPSPADDIGTNPANRAKLHDVAMVSADEGWAVGTTLAAGWPSEFVLRYENNTWSVAYPGVGGRYVEMLPSGEGWFGSYWTCSTYHTQATELLPTTDTCFDAMALLPGGYGVAVAGAHIYHLQNGQWWDQQVHSTVQGVAIDAVSPSEAWAVGNDTGTPHVRHAATLLHYVDGAWQNLAAPLRLWAVDVLPGGEGWAVGGQSGRANIVRLNGDQWQQVSAPTDYPLYGVDTVSPTEAWAVGYQGVILHYVDGVWQNVSSPTTCALGDVTMLSAQEGWAVGDRGAILHYSNGQWQLVSECEQTWSSPRAYSASASVAAMGDEVWVTDWSTIHILRAGTWATEEHGSCRFEHVQLTAPGEGWIATNGALAPIHSGQIVFPPGFSCGDVNHSPRYTDFHILPSGQGWAVDDSSFFLYHFDGQALQPVSKPTHLGLEGVSMASEQAGWAVGDGVLLRYSDGNWAIAVTARPAQFLYDIDMLSPTDGWAVGSDILHYLNGTWAKVPNPTTDLIVAVKMISATEGWAAAGDKLLHYDGQRWRLHTALPDAVKELDGLAANDVWARGKDIYHYDGQTWSQVSLPDPYAEPAAIQVVAPGVVLAAAGRTLYRYQNGGWNEDSGRAPTSIDKLAFTSATSGWAFGVSGNTTYNTDRCHIMRYADGRWTDLETPVLPAPPGAGCGDAAVAGPFSGWIVGTGDWRLGDPETIQYNYLPVVASSSF